MSELNTGKYQAYPEYKDSSSKWLDSIPSHWKVTFLKHVLSTPITDGPHSTPVFIDEGIPFVSAEAVSGGYIDFDKIRGFISKEDDAFFSQKYSPKRHDVYMIKSGATTGITAIVETDKHFNIWSPLAVMRCKNTYNPYFLLNSLRSDFFQKSVQLSWTFGTQQNIGMGTLENLTVCYPPLEEQIQIANFLDHETAKIDNLIEKQQQLIKLLKEKRQAVISHVVTKGIPNKEHPNVPMKDSGVEWLGEVPAHWVVSPLKHFISDNKGAVKVGPFGSHLKNTDMLGSDVKVIAQKNVIAKSANIGEAFISWGKYEELKTFTIEKRDLLVTTRGTLGRAYIYESDELAILHPCLIRLQCNEEKIIPELLAIIIERSGYAMEQILISSNSTTIEVIYSESLINTVICIPNSLTEQLSLLGYIEQQDIHFDTLIDKATNFIELMQERRIALISAAVTGKIDVRNWEQPND
ncbi:restriction endonuclease subunit S [Pseudoalteromonas arctica]|uniref:restriction endonuclease subunit S n=1 Tax=Pseudoalteromonas arctica TaxID=394751 RepID=UPI00145C30B7|nr:restriction endonuclease subunit S [Pseudoalteromonas arctica]NMP78789.1 restriction endonuclease subunit S [Pseudoalteromonas arctica]